ncbi:MAG: FtsW/RodA/SpoVE family cell cycle protein [Pelolinea sp.]|nr:FtsW/RodA/SpoVE family cell cycle protein [Pelolinea sp.]
MSLLAKSLEEIRTGVRSRLSWFAVIFLGLFSLILTLSPAVKYRSWSADLVWSHWLGFILWCAGFFWFLKLTKKYLNLNDPTLVSVFGLLIGWGILTIWRINFIFGLRQAIWFLTCVGFSYLFFRQPQILSTFKKYKYLLLAFGLILSALTFLFGTYPGGESPRLWLGFKGLYFQPSELLKLLLIIYLSAYFSDNNYSRIRIIQTIFPTVVLVLAALFILIAQHDLGTALIFIAIYIFMLFITFGKKRILAIGLGIIAISTIVGYFSIDLIRIRFQGWMLPWADTQAGSYQITQSIIAIAVGGLSGAGIGLGNPRLIPISHSDFIYSAIVEETGLFGSIALVLLFALLLFRGFSIAIRTSNLYYRYLAAGISLFLTSQAILIIGGNIRLLPITGVTLPFLSYGGSSLLISFLSACILLFIESDHNRIDENRYDFRAFHILGLLFAFSFLLIALATGWWAIIRSRDLQLRADNPRHLIAAQFVKRGAILDRNDTVIVSSVGEIGQFTRKNQYAPLSNTVGFIDSTYGSAGLEASQEDYLGGEKGYPAFDMWFNYLLFDQPLPGRDVRLTVDLKLQKAVDELLQPFIGSAIVLNAENGEILAIASHPYINSNDLKNSWGIWKSDPDSPFINRAVQGAYPIDSLFTPFLLSQINPTDLPDYDLSIQVANSITSSGCAIVETEENAFNQAIMDGCPSALIQTIGITGSNKVRKVINDFMLTRTPDIGLPINETVHYVPDLMWHDLFFSEDPLRVSPLQIAASASAITHHGLIPNPQILSAVDTSEEGWVFLSEKKQSRGVSADQANSINDFLKSKGISGWEITAQGVDSNSNVSWFVAGTPSNWSGTPITVVLVLEEQNPFKARSTGRAIYSLATE